MAAVRSVLVFLTKGCRNEREKPPKHIAGPTPTKRRGHFDDFGARRPRKSRDAAGNSTNCNANRKVLLFQFVSVPLLVFRPVRDFVGNFSFGQKITKAKEDAEQNVSIRAAPILLGQTRKSARA